MHHQFSVIPIVTVNGLEIKSKYINLNNNLNVKAN